MEVATKEDVEYDSDGPEVTPFVIGALQDLRRDVEWRADFRTQVGAFLEELREPIVNNLDNRAVLFDGDGSISVCLLLFEDYVF